jgi:TolB protein
VTPGGGLGPPLEFAPAWAPDGGRLVFGRLDGHTGLVVHDLPSGAETQLTDVYDRSPVWSPDGSTIAFKRGKDIYLVDTDGTDLRVLASGTAPDWSPDGTTLAYVRHDRLCLLTVATRRRRCLLRGVSPAWSPDGRRLAFSRDGDLFVVRADGTHERRLTRTPSFFETAPDWQPVLRAG